MGVCDRKRDKYNALERKKERKKERKREREIILSKSWGIVHELAWVSVCVSTCQVKTWRKFETVSQQQMFESGMLQALPIMRHDKPVKIHTQTLEESDDQFLIVLWAESMQRLNLKLAETK